MLQTTEIHAWFALVAGACAGDEGLEKPGWKGFIGFSVVSE